MAEYTRDYTKDFLKDLKKIKSNAGLQKRLKAKIEEILNNPFHYKSLRHALKNMRRTHIGNFVLIFEINQNQKTVIFNKFQDHDRAYS